MKAVDRMTAYAAFSRKQSRLNVTGIPYAFCNFVESFLPVQVMPEQHHVITLQLFVVELIVLPYVFRYLQRCVHFVLLEIKSIPAIIAKCYVHIKLDEDHVRFAEALKREEEGKISRKT